MGPGCAIADLCSGPTLPSAASAEHGSYLGISCRHWGRRATAEDDPRQIWPSQQAGPLGPFRLAKMIAEEGNYLSVQILVKGNAIKVRSVRTGREWRQPQP